MMMTIIATKQQQARRFAELYGNDPYARRMLGYPYGQGLYGRGFEDELFWDDFESGRRGALMQHQRDRAHADAFFRLQARPPPPSRPPYHELARERCASVSSDVAACAAACATTPASRTAASRSVLTRRAGTSSGCARRVATPTRNRCTPPATSRAL